MIGYIGLGLLLLAYVLLITPFQKYFIPVDVVASVALSIHGAIIKDVPIAAANAFIALVLVVKYVQSKKLDKGLTGL